MSDSIIFRLANQAPSAILSSQAITKIQELEKENADLKARLAHVESELEKSDKTLMHYACYETQYASDNNAPCTRDDDGRIIDDYDYSQGHFKQFGKRARQRIKERKGHLE